MSLIKTNKVITHGSSNLELVSSGGTVVITGSNLSTTADGMFTSGASAAGFPTQPISKNHLSRKDYVDRHTRIGATVSFTMGITTAYTSDNSIFGFTHQPVTNNNIGIGRIGFPTGQLWTGWAAVTKGIGGNTTHTYVVGQTFCIPENWSTTVNLARVCLTRVS